MPQNTNQGSILKVSIKKKKVYNYYKASISIYKVTYSKLFPFTKEGYDDAYDWIIATKKEKYIDYLK